VFSDAGDLSLDSVKNITTDGSSWGCGDNDGLCAELGGISWDLSKVGIPVFAFQGDSCSGTGMPIGYLAYPEGDAGGDCISYAHMDNAYPFGVGPSSDGMVSFDMSYFRESTPSNDTTNSTTAAPTTTTAIRMLRRLQNDDAAKIQATGPCAGATFDADMALPVNGADIGITSLAIATDDYKSFFSGDCVAAGNSTSVKAAVKVPDDFCQDEAGETGGICTHDSNAAGLGIMMVGLYMMF